MKNTVLYLGLFVLAVFVLLFLVKLIIKKKHFFINSILGTIGLIAINSISAFSGISLGYSILSVIVSVLLGLPGVAFLVIEKLI